MKKTTASVLIFFAMCAVPITGLIVSGCGDGKESFFDTRDARQIEGFWMRANYPKTTYYFSNGIVTAETWFGFDHIIDNEFTYRTKQDSVLFPMRKTGAGLWEDWNDKWRVEFPGPDTCTVFSGGLKIGLNRM